MGIVHHSNYIIYAELARAELLRQFGSSYKEMEARGVVMPVVEVVMNYFSPAYYDDVLTIKISTERTVGARVVFEHEIYNEKGIKVNSGHVTLAFMSADTHRPCRPPRWFVDLFRVS